MRFHILLVASVAAAFGVLAAEVETWQTVGDGEMAQLRNGLVCKGASVLAIAQAALGDGFLLSKRVSDGCNQLVLKVRVPTGMILLLR